MYRSSSKPLLLLFRERRTNILGKVTGTDEKHCSFSQNGGGYPARKIVDPLQNCISSTVGFSGRTLNPSPYGRTDVSPTLVEKRESSWRGTGTSFSFNYPRDRRTRGRYYDCGCTRWTDLSIILHPLPGPVGHPLGMGVTWGRGRGGGPLIGRIGRFKDPEWKG